MGDNQIMNLHLLENCWSFRFVPEILYCYREGCGGTNRFSKTEARDIDAIKRYQLQFFQSLYSNRKLIERNLYAETAAWFYVYIQESIDHLNDGEIIDMIEDALEFDTFKPARVCFLQRSTESWETVNLLRKANSEVYLQSAKTSRRKSFVKRKVKK